MAIDGRIDLQAVRDYQQAACSEDGFAAWLQGRLAGRTAGVRGRP
jgi:hypothetical protein